MCSSIPGLYVGAGGPSCPALAVTPKNAADIAARPLEGRMALVDGSFARRLMKTLKWEPVDEKTLGQVRAGG